MSLIITFMFVPAKLQMNWASASGRINLRAETTGRAGISGWPAATEFSATRDQHPNGRHDEVAQLPACRFDL
jgi:hypothetical protein